jgi:hypothetical protein
VWDGHPLEEEALGELVRFRERMSDLRRRIATHNANGPMPIQLTRVVTYAGQYIIENEESEDVQNESD